MRLHPKNYCTTNFIITIFLVGGLLSLFHHHFNSGVTVNPNRTCKTASSDNTDNRRECDSPASDNNIVNQDQVNYPWKEEPNCQHFTVQFARNNSRPKWALTSFPGSGVTWTRQLIEGVTGIYTGTIYGSGEPPVITGNHGNEADVNCECTILIKDHDTAVPDFASFPTRRNNLGNQIRRGNKRRRGSTRSSLYDNRGILLLRNPMDALFTYAHFLGSSENQTGIVSPDDFVGPQFDNYVDYVADTWADHAVGWIQDIQNGTVLFYERLLLEDTAAELKRLLSVIDFSDPHHPPVDPERMRCTLLHKDRADRKRSKKPEIPLTSSHRSKLMFAINRVQNSLRKKGWPLLPVDLFDLRSRDEDNIDSV